MTCAMEGSHQTTGAVRGTGAGTHEKGRTLAAAAELPSGRRPGVTLGAAPAWPRADAAATLQDPRRPFGLLSMRERVEPFGGSVSITSRPDHGTAVDVRLPLPAHGSAT